jgi:Ca2+-binding RTX toxin-like protein
MKTFQRLIALGILTLLLFSAVTAIAAANTVPATLLDHRTLFANLNDLKPSACGGIFVTNLITGTGTIIGTAANDLVLASSTVDSIDGLDGDDCIVGGGENDICLGGLGSDIFISCEVETQ